jgi:hypothetical protein
VRINFGVGRDIYNIWILLLWFVYSKYYIYRRFLVRFCLFFRDFFRFRLVRFPPKLLMISSLTLGGNVGNFSRIIFNFSSTATGRVAADDFGGGGGSIEAAADDFGGGGGGIEAAADDSKEGPLAFITES